MSSLAPLSVNLVLHDFARGWIIEKMALKLRDALEELGVEAQVSSAVCADFTVNHSMIFHYLDARPRGVNTMAVTHVDDALKVDMVRRHLAKGVDAAICMSAMTVDQLVGYGVDRARLTYVLPAHDNAMQPRRIVIGITSNNPIDGRKRDWLLTRLADDMPLDAFEFQIFGWGWDEVADQLRAAGAVVSVALSTPDYHADYVALKAAVPHFDYYFYPGLDEGSMGLLDALSAGVKTIVTNQGFHLDIPHGITHGFWDYDELRGIFERLRDDRRGRVEAAGALTWRRYAERHLDIWKALIAGERFPSTDMLPSDVVAEPLEHTRGAMGQYPLVSYRQILHDPFRRAMTFRFWIPRTHKLGLRLRGLVARALRSTRPAT